MDFTLDVIMRSKSVIWAIEAMDMASTKRRAPRMRGRKAAVKRSKSVAICTKLGVSLALWTRSKAC